MTHLERTAANEADRNQQLTYRALMNKLISGEDISSSLEDQARYIQDGASGALSIEQFAQLQRRFELQNHTNRPPVESDSHAANQPISAGTVFDTNNSDSVLQSEYLGYKVKGGKYVDPETDETKQNRIALRRVKGEEFRREQMSDDRFASVAKGGGHPERHCFIDGEDLVNKPHSTDAHDKIIGKSFTGGYDHLHLDDPLTGRRPVEKQPDKEHIRSPSSQKMRIAPRDDGLNNARRNVRQTKKADGVARGAKAKTGEFIMRGTAGSDGFEQIVDDMGDEPAAKSLEIQLALEEREEQRLRKSAPIIDWGGKHQKKLTDVRGRMKKLQDKIDLAEKEAAERAARPETHGILNRIFQRLTNDRPSQPHPEEQAPAKTGVQDPGETTQKEPTLWDKLWGTKSPSDDSSGHPESFAATTPDHPSTALTTRDRTESQPMSPEDMAMIESYTAQGYKYLGLQNGRYVFKKGSNTVEITA